MSTQSQSVSVSTILLSAGAAIAVGGIAYAAYFDYKRRNDPAFRKHLKRQHQKVAKAHEMESKSAEREHKKKIEQIVADARSGALPTEMEEMESYFMNQVAEAERKCSDGSDILDAAASFYRALKVYPQPRELISIYDKTVPKPILDALAEMIALDPSISVSGPSSATGSDSGTGSVE
ncbi:protein import receptor MAS20 [Piedraia hortae CBS 480.64]|uniref:Mitochondrial import receptor subunit TOM20 n=1 Tax=Piedraia hortae CBS 480.64 TaxID=1314780 RepID=A0A6A7C0X1_9PEZI|nr:protein import receptor MAS20 [Piedraia hortae CBS 480.64]